MPDLFAFARAAWRIGDWHFLNPFSQPAKLGSHFGTEFETVTFQAYAREQRPTENFIAGRLVVDSGTVKYIGQVSQELRAQEKP